MEFKMKNMQHKRQGQMILFFLGICMTIFLIPSINTALGDVLTGGFNMSSAGVSEPYGIYTNGTDFFVTDATDKWMYHFSKTGTNLTGFSLTSASPTGNFLGTTSNGTDFWVVEYNLGTVYHFDKDGNNMTDAFKTSTAGNDAPYGITFDSRDKSFWVTDTGDDFVYHYNSAGVNQSDGFKTSVFGSLDPVGIVYDAKNNSFWIVEYGTEGVYHVSVTGTNLSDGFKLTPAGSEDPYGITIDPIDNSFWTIDKNGRYIYHFEGLPAPLSELTVNLLSPINNTYVSLSSIYFAANYSYDNMNISNATYYIWYPNNSLFNKTIITVSSAQNKSNLSISNFIYGIYKWNVYGCGENSTDMICSWGSKGNYSFEIGAIVNQEIYNNNTYETERESFFINVTVLSGSTIYGAYLVYNSTQFIVSNITSLGENYILYREIDIPPNYNSYINETRPFFWSFMYSTGVIISQQNLSSRNQSVGNINIIICNSTYPITTLNFTLMDELTNAKVNAVTNVTSIFATFNFWKGLGTSYKNYSYSALAQNLSNYTFCIYPGWIELKTNMNLEYEADDYSPRTYYFRNATLNNQTKEIYLQNLLSTYSVKFFIDVKKGFTPFTNAVITINKYFSGEGIFKTLDIRKTDENGQFIEYLDLDKEYEFGIVKDGVSYGIINRQASCQQAPCTISLQLEEVEIDIWSGYYDFFAGSIVYDLNYDDTSKIVTFTFQDITGLAQYFRLNVNRISLNQSTQTICNNVTYGVMGTLTCNMTGYEGDFRVDAYVSRSPEKFVNYLLIAIQTIKDVLGPLGIFSALLIIITIALVGAWNPAVGVILIAFSVLMMKFLGFVAFGYTTVILIFIMAIIIMFKIKS